jgi:hypothetical protein
MQVHIGFISAGEYLGNSDPARNSLLFVDKLLGQINPLLYPSTQFL